MDKVFKALSDSTRRQILDALVASDGQTVSELEARFPAVTRFAVMKHLKVLEQAQLLSTRKVGRCKHHFLNTVPIQEIADRWISRFAAPWAQGLIDLKTDIEKGNENKERRKA